MSIGSGNGLVPSRRQAIIKTHADPVHWRTNFSGTDIGRSYGCQWSNSEGYGCNRPGPNGNTATHTPLSLTIRVRCNEKQCLGHNISIYGKNTDVKVIHHIITVSCHVCLTVPQITDISVVLATACSISVLCIDSSLWGETTGEQRANTESILMSWHLHDGTNPYIIEFAVWFSIRIHHIHR